MEHTQTPGRRLNVLGKAERRKRIFARLREGWAYEEIAGEERLSAERIRQIVRKFSIKGWSTAASTTRICSSNA